jgi:predicted Zn-dependent protease
MKWGRLAVVVVIAVAAAIAPQRLARADTGADLERKYGVVSDPALNSRLARVGTIVFWSVRENYPDFRRAKTKLRFKILKDKDLNAMALPDGRLYVTSGMMEALADRPDDELAALLGHEATHVAQKHSRRQAKQSLIGALLGALLGRAVGGGDSASTGAQIGGGLVGAAYSRDDEYRADAGGVQLVCAAGYDPQAMARVLETLKSKYGRGQAKTPVIGWFASHPDTGKRIENAQRRAGECKRPEGGKPAAVRDMWTAKDYTLHLRPKDAQPGDRRVLTRTVHATLGQLISSDALVYSQQANGAEREVARVAIDDVVGDQVHGTLASPEWDRLRLSGDETVGFAP